MSLYYVERRATGEWARVKAPNAQDACERLGWLIGDCYIRVGRAGPYIQLTLPLAVAEQPRKEYDAN